MSSFEDCEHVLSRLTKSRVETNKYIKVEANVNLGSIEISRVL